MAPALQRSLAEIFAQRVRPDGVWRVLASSREVWLVLRTFARFLATLENPPTSIATITPQIWAQWRMSRSPSTSGKQQIRKSAAFLKDHPQLPETTRDLLKQRVSTNVVRETAYRPEEFDRIKVTATRVFRTALHRIRDNQAILRDWRAGRINPDYPQWPVGEALDHISRTGDIPTCLSATPDPSVSRRSDHRRVRPVLRYQQLLGGAGHTWQRMFLSSEEAAALVVLMVATYGWNAVPVSELRVPDATPDPGINGHVIYRVELEKRRRGAPMRYETRNLTDWGANSPGRLITQAIEATAPARAALALAGTPSDRLVIWRRHLTRDPDEPMTALFDVGMRENAWRNWRSELGAGVNLNLRRLRKTVIVAHQRTPTQHTRDTHDQVYVLPDPQTWERSAPAITEGITNALTHARTTFAATVGREDIDAGRDTAVAGCTDYTHSPFGEYGKPCRASFLLCTACPNAVVTPRHLPRLAYLHHLLDSLRDTLPAEVWDHDWREHHARIHDLKHRPDFTDVEWTDALTAISTADKDTIDQLLRKGFDA